MRLGRRLDRPEHRDEDRGVIDQPPELSRGNANVGCLEAIAGGGSLAQQLAEAGESATRSRDVVRLVLAGNPLAVRLVRDAGRVLGEVLAGTVNFLVKALVGRERPFVHALPDAEKDRTADPDDNNLSFYSGHSTLSMSLAVSAGQVASMRPTPSRSRRCMRSLSRHASSFILIKAGSVAT